MERKADYVLALRENLHEDVELFAQSQKAQEFSDTQGTRQQSVEGDHGRVETRITTVFHAVGWLDNRHDWSGLKSLVMVENIRDIGERVERESRYYVRSRRAPAPQMAALVRGHWAVENSLHWVLEVLFRDDECRARTAHALVNFTTIKHMALNLLQRSRDKLSVRARRKAAAWEDDFLAGLLSGQGEPA